MCVLGAIIVKKMPLKIMLIIVLVGLMMPNVLAETRQKILEDQGSDIVIAMRLHNITWNGYFYYNVTNMKNETIENATILLDVQGGAIFHGNVHVSTAIVIKNLSGPLHSKLYRTRDQIFPRILYPVFGRPLIGTVVIRETYKDQFVDVIVRILFSFIAERSSL